MPAPALALGWSLCFCGAGELCLWLQTAGDVHAGRNRRREEDATMPEKEKEKEKEKTEKEKEKTKKERKKERKKEKKERKEKKRKKERSRCAQVGLTCSGSWPCCACLPGARTASALRPRQTAKRHADTWSPTTDELGGPATRRDLAAPEAD